MNQQHPAQVAARPQGDGNAPRFVAMNAVIAVSAHAEPITIENEWNVFDTHPENDQPFGIIPFNTNASTAQAVAFQLNLEWRRQTSEPF